MLGESGKIYFQTDQCAYMSLQNTLCRHESNVKEIITYI